MERQHLQALVKVGIPGAWFERALWQAQAVAKAGSMRITDPACQQRQSRFHVQCARQRIPVQPKRLRIFTREEFGEQCVVVLAGHNFPGDVAWRVTELVIAQTGEIIAAAALAATAALFATTGGERRRFAGWRGIHQTALRRCCIAPGPDQTEWIGGFQRHSRQRQPAALPRRNGQGRFKLVVSGNVDADRRLLLRPQAQR